MGVNHNDDVGCGPREFMTFILGLAAGTGSTITIKIVYSLSTIDSEGNLTRFEKPLTTTWIMFLAMASVLPYYFYCNWRDRRHLSEKERQESEIPWSTYLMIMIPSCFDLVGTALAKVGLMYCTVSIYQLVRCSVIIVTALLKGSLRKYQWFGITINMIAMIVVSISAFIPGAIVQAGGQEGGSNYSSDPRMGIFFILLSCCVQGAQFVFEERVMRHHSAPPMMIVGMEGFWGAVLMAIFVFPAARMLPGSDRGGCMENLYDSWVMIQNSWEIVLVLFGFYFTVCFYNVFSLFITYLLNSIWHAILENFRPISVWSSDLLIYYVVTKQTFGEAWTPYSFLELAGCALLITGTFIYQGSIMLPFFEYPVVETDVEGEPVDPTHVGSGTIGTPQGILAAPSPMIARGAREYTPTGLRKRTAQYMRLNQGGQPDYGAAQ